MVQAEAAKSYYGPFVLNCQAPDEGNMHTLLHWGTDKQKGKYLRPLCEGTGHESCFAMTEPEVAGSDPTLIQTTADTRRGGVGHPRAQVVHLQRPSGQFAILIARTEDNPDLPQAANTAFLVDLPSEGWTEVRQIETMHGGSGHSEIPYRWPLRASDKYARRSRSGSSVGPIPPRPCPPSHCMRWLAQAETALDMMVDRSLNRYSHGSLLAEKQGIQWMIADPAQWSSTSPS